MVLIKKCQTKPINFMAMTRILATIACLIIAFNQAGSMSGNKIKNLLSTATKLMTKDMNEVDMPGETSKGSRYRKTYHRYKSVIAMGNL